MTGAAPDDEIDYVPSPCVRICRIDPQRGLCVGCRRTLEEITLWGSLGPDGRRDILSRLKSRA